jgi:hypothetical protein
LYRMQSDEVWHEFRLNCVSKRRRAGGTIFPRPDAASFQPFRWRSEPTLHLVAVVRRPERKLDQLEVGGEYTTGVIAPLIFCPNASRVETVNVFDPTTSGTKMLYAPVESAVVVVVEPPF